MNFDKLERISKRPPLYEKGDAIMWTDPHISQQLLQVHLNPNLDLASRTPASIEATMEFLLPFCDNQAMKILDLGCGPGLYAERMANAGHEVTGVDFSQSSIDYATNQAKSKKLSIKYFCQDYLTIDFQEEFDIVMLVYTDLGVLVPEDRQILLGNIHRALKPGGTFVFDVINDKNIDAKFVEQRSWNFEKSGFWMDAQYFELMSGFHYQEDGVYLQQHILVDESESFKIYRFWTHYFNEDDVAQMMLDAGFREIESYENILPATSLWNGENITFFTAEKN